MGGGKSDSGTWEWGAGGGTMMFSTGKGAAQPGQDLRPSLAKAQAVAEEAIELLLAGAALEPSAIRQPGASPQRPVIFHCAWL